jgi:hypothetical protein
MKNKLFKLALSLTFLVASVFTFSACDLFDDATDVTFSQDFVTSLQVVPGEAIDLEKVIKLEDNAEVAKYMDKLKEVVVESATYHVEEYQGEDDAKFTGETGFMGVGGNGISVSFENLDLKAATTPVSFGFDDLELTSISSHLKNEKEAVFSVNGDVTSGPNFGGCKLVVTLKLKITAEAL